MKKLVAILLVAVSAVSIAAIMSPAYAADDFTFPMVLRPGVAVAIHVDLQENPCTEHGRTVLFVHGLAHTGNTFDPLVDEIFNDSSVRRAIIVNMPGRGGSSLPYGDLFGNLSLEDYATVIVKTLGRCKARGVAPTEIVAHSMGGLVVQVVQERLLSHGTSLRQAFGVKKVRFIGSSTPMQVPDPFLESGAGLYLLSLYTASDPAKGQYLSTDEFTFLGLFFTDLTGNFVPNTPSPQNVIDFGYKSDEAFVAASQTVGTADMRPSVRSGAFAPANGTSLRVIVGSQDVFSDLTVQQSLYEHLTGDLTDAGFRVITSANAVHDQFISNPEEVAPVLGL